MLSRRLLSRLAKAACLEDSIGVDSNAIDQYFSSLFMRRDWWPSGWRNVERHHKAFLIEPNPVARFHCVEVIETTKPSVTFDVAIGKERKC